MKSIWLRHNLACSKDRLKALSDKVAEDDRILTESQVAAMERKKHDDDACGEIETQHPGYLGSQDTYYVGTFKGICRVYQQTFVDTYSKVVHAKLYTTKTPITAADMLNDIEHTRTKVKSPQTNGICERFHKTILNEFYQITLRKKIYQSIEELQADLDEWLTKYNAQRTQQGKMCWGERRWKHSSTENKSGRGSF